MSAAALSQPLVVLFQQCAVSNADDGEF